MQDSESEEYRKELIIAAIDGMIGCCESSE